MRVAEKIANISEEEIMHAVLKSGIENRLSRDQAFDLFEDMMRDDSMLQEAIRDAKNQIEVLEGLLQDLEIEFEEVSSECVNVDVVEDVKECVDEVEGEGCLEEVSVDEDFECDIGCDVADEFLLGDRECDEDVSSEFEGFDFYDDGDMFCECEGKEVCDLCCLDIKNDDFRSGPVYTEPFDYGRVSVINCSGVDGVVVDFMLSNHDRIDDDEDDMEVGADVGRTSVICGSEALSLGYAANVVMSMGNPVYADFSTSSIQDCVVNSLCALVKDGWRIGHVFKFLGGVIMSEHVYDYLEESYQGFEDGIDDDISVDDFENDVVAYSNPYGYFPSDLKMAVPCEREKVCVIMSQAPDGLDFN